jgi:hypothetical protein
MASWTASTMFTSSASVILPRISCASCAQILIDASMAASNTLFSVFADVTSPAAAKLHPPPNYRRRKPPGSVYPHPCCPAIRVSSHRIPECKHFFLDNPMILNYLFPLIIIRFKKFLGSSTPPRRGRSGRVPRKSGLIPPPAGL